MILKPSLRGFLKRSLFYQIAFGNKIETSLFLITKKISIMKRLHFILSLVFLATVFFTSCDKNPVEPTDDNIVPESFSVEIPASLKSSTQKTTKSTQGNVMTGNETYENLTTFINAGDEAAKIVEGVIKTIRSNNLSQPMSFSYASDDDSRVKNVVIVSDSEFEGTTWNYQMTITDADSEGNDDGGVAIQIFWNTGTVEGVAIMKPYNIDRDTEDMFAHAMFRIDYSEAGNNGYEQEMTVYISGITLPDAMNNPYAMETMKMTVGKKGNIIDVFGNSNHPNAYILQSEMGFNWAFVAAGETDSDIGVAEVGLPPSDLSSSSREVILGTYSIKNVFTNEITRAFPAINPNDLAIYLQNMEAPGYFNAHGFVQSGIAPSTDYNDISSSIERLVPFNPSEVSSLKVEFKASVSVK